MSDTLFDTTTTRIIGIDPSLTSTGIAILTGHQTDTFTIGSKGKADATWQDRYDRLRKLTELVNDAVSCRSLVILESPAYSSITGHMHDRSGFWWLLYSALNAQRCTVLCVDPRQRMKYATGKGNASKDAVLAAAIKRYPDIDIPGNDIADAVVLMAIGARLAGHPLEASLPQTHLDALAKLTMPVAR